MDGIQDETRLEGQGAAQEPQGAPAQVSGEDGAAEGGGETLKVDNDGVQACKDYEAAPRERDERIAELEGTIAEAAKSAEAAEELRAEMDELRRQGEEQRVEFELTMAGARNVRAARALLDEHGGDVSRLKEAEPWLFEGAVPRQGGKTGLPNAGAASDEGKTMKRWREIAGIADEE